MKLKQILFAAALFLFAHANLNAQTNLAYSKDDCEKYRSLYFQYLKQGMNRDAMNFWQMAYGYCGGSDSLDTKFFTNGRAGYLKLYEAETDVTKKAELRDSVYWIYEVLIKKDGQNAADWKGKYANMLMQENDPRIDKIDSLFKECVHVLKSDTYYSYIRQYFKHLIQNKYNTAPADKKEEVRNYIIDEYLVLSDYCSEGASKKRAAADEEGAVKYDEAQDFLDKYFVQIVNDCNMLTSVVEKKLGSLPQAKDAKGEKVKSYIALLDKKKCETTPTYGKLMDTLLTLDPTAEAYFITGNYYLKTDNCSKAVEYFSKAAELETDVDKKNEYTYWLATAQYCAKSYSAAYRTAKTVEGKYKGAAMKICGDSIAATANGCGDTTFDRKANYWLANDYYRKAAALGEDVSTSKYLSSAPTQQEGFEVSVNSGASVYLSCWGESTTARY